MKKIISIVLAFVLTFGMLSVLASAADVTVTLEVDKTEVNVGDIVTLTGSLSANSGLGALTVDVTYDDTMLEIIDPTPEDTTDDRVITYNLFSETANPEFDGKNIIRYVGAVKDVVNDAGKLFSVQFKAISSGTADIDASIYEAADGNNQLVDVSVNSVEVVIAEAEHTHSFGEWVETTAATCTEDGSQERACECGEKETEVIPATGHAYGEANIISHPTCLIPGSQTSVCATCGDVKTELIPTVEHVYGNPTVTKEATCANDGEEKAWCINCNMPKVTVIPALPHTEGEWEITKAPTKTEEGERVKKCTVCGTVIETEVLEMLPEFVAGDITGDGYVKAIDARNALKANAGTIELTEEQLKAGDVTGDGKVTALDARWILQYVAGVRPVL